MSSALIGAGVTGVGVAQATTHNAMAHAEKSDANVPGKSQRMTMVSPVECARKAGPSIAIPRSVRTNVANLSPVELASQTSFFPLQVEDRVQVPPSAAQSLSVVQEIVQ